MNKPIAKTVPAAIALLDAVAEMLRSNNSNVKIFNLIYRIYYPSLYLLAFTAVIVVGFGIKP